VNSKKNPEGFEFGQNLFIIESDANIYDGMALYYVFIPYILLLHYFIIYPLNFFFEPFDIIRDYYVLLLRIFVLNQITSLQLIFENLL